MCCVYLTHRRSSWPPPVSLMSCSFYCVVVLFHRCLTFLCCSSFWKQLQKPKPIRPLNSTQAYRWSITVKEKISECLTYTSPRQDGWGLGLDFCCPCFFWKLFPVFLWHNLCVWSSWLAHLTSCPLSWGTRDQCGGLQFVQRSLAYYWIKTPEVKAPN